MTPATDSEWEECAWRKPATPKGLARLAERVTYFPEPPNKKTVAIFKFEDQIGE